jgi:hypothetical protein
VALSKVCAAVADVSATPEVAGGDVRPISDLVDIASEADTSVVGASGLVTDTTIVDMFVVVPPGVVDILLVVAAACVLPVVIVSAAVVPAWEGEFKYVSNYMGQDETLQFIHICTSAFRQGSVCSTEIPSAVAQIFQCF